MTGGVRVPNDLIGIDDLHLAAAPTTLASSLRIGGMLFRGTSPHCRYSLCGKFRLGQHRLVRVVLAGCAHLRRVRQVPEVVLIGARHQLGALPHARERAQRACRGSALGRYS